MFTKKFDRKNKAIILIIAFLVTFMVLSVPTLPECMGEREYEVSSPYADVDWDNFEHYKGSFHSHTTESDGWYSVKDSIHGHENHGFDILAISDHFGCTYPWEEYSVDSNDIDMLAVPGSEPTFDGHPLRLDGHHTITLFTEAESSKGVWGSGAEPRGWLLGFEEVMKVVGGHKEHPETGEQHDGIQFFAHPEWHEEEYTGRDWGWYAQYFEDYDHIIGLEILNTSANNYSEYNTNIFDSLLKYFGSDREIYGLGVTDRHYSDLNAAWTTVLAPERTIDSVRSSMEEGRMFFVQNLGPGEPPQVTEIIIRDEKIELDIEGKYEEVRWIFDGETIETGENFTLNNIKENQNYVRFEIWGEGGHDNANIVGSQPFYFENVDLDIEKPKTENPPETQPWPLTIGLVGVFIAGLVLVGYNVKYKGW